MAAVRVWLHKLLFAGGFAVAVVAAPLIGSLTAHPSETSVPLAACTSGEEEDTFTTVCTPMLVPNAGAAPFRSIPGNPDLPSVELPGGGGAIPCTGHNAGTCIGLAEEDAAEGPAPVPRSTISSSP